ncbi:S-layer homology domain-containing protein [Paenibacillus qinlingensis]|uniref:S-layer homology domain-containing protein n=1 Tax=Paenibacillus qinlingensis TaxID=1837343 RepID=UPI001566541F|nr:S-layer homology domain-containing protein [Paenibacillus qinlingensis]NQX60749.1 S-layer homology domain-containing protein [Paenibacillus qinlingensis]
MKTYFKLASCLMLLVSLTMSLFSWNSYAATAQPTYAVTFSSNTVETGQTITMTIKGQQVANLYGMEIVFTYDAERLQYVDKSGSPDITPNRDLFPENASLEVAPKVEGNQIIYAITKTGQAPASQGDFNLITLNFKALEQGNAVVHLISVKLGASGTSPAIWTDGVSSSLPITSRSVSGSNGNNNGNNNANGNLPPVVGTNIVQLTPQLNQGTAKATLTVDLLNQLQSQKGSDATNKKTVVIPPTEGATAYALSIPSAFFQTNGGIKQVDIQTPLATVIVPKDMLKNNELSQSDNVVLSVQIADTSAWSSELRTMIGKNPVIDLNIEIDGQKVAWHNEKVPVTVSLPYQPTAEELLHPEYVNVWYVDDSGNVQRLPSGRYDAATGRVIFQTTHWSKYAAVYEIRSFMDIKDIAWAQKPIEVLASKGIINGVTDTQFGPKNDITRADFISLLVRTLDLNTDNADVSSFEDVQASDYFFKSVSIARSLGITNGANGNAFMPNAPISRQDLMVMSVRALQLTNKLILPSDASGISAFADHADIASYAKTSVAALVQQGIISGDGTHIRPTDNMTRAEAAKLLYELYSKYANLL